jgi:hypothetical protein
MLPVPVKARCVFETRPACWSGAVAIKRGWRTQEGMLPLRVVAHDPFSKRP